MNFRACWVCESGEHPYAAAEPHPDVEELEYPACALRYYPQGVRSIMLNAVVGLRVRFCQVGGRSRARCPRLTRKIVGHRLKYGMSTTGLAVGNSQSPAKAARE